MLHDNRRWSADGNRIIGIATDGRPDQVLIALPAPLDQPAEDHAATIREAVRLFNGLTNTQQKLYDAIRAHEETNDWPATPSELQATTGISLSWLWEQLHELANAGLVEMPPKGGTGVRRQVRTTNPKVGTR